MRVCSLFSGIGGIDLGFIQAGFDVVWANEFDKDASATFRNNFPEINMVEKDIKNLTEKEISFAELCTKCMALFFYIDSM